MRVPIVSSGGFGTLLKRAVVSGLMRFSKPPPSRCRRPLELRHTRADLLGDRPLNSFHRHGVLPRDVALAQAALRWSEQQNVADKLNMPPSRKLRAVGKVAARHCDRRFHFLRVMK